MNNIIFYNILLLALLCVFIPSVYSYMYTTFIGRIIIILLIAYFSKVNFYVALAFITLIINSLCLSCCDNKILNLLTHLTK